MAHLFNDWPTVLNPHYMQFFLSLHTVHLSYLFVSPQARKKDVAENI